MVVGIRPESVAQSPNGPVAGRTLELDVALTEALGSDLLVHADVDAPVVLTADQEELAEDVVPDDAVADDAAAAAGRAGAGGREGPGRRSTSSGCTSSTRRPSGRSADVVRSAGHGGHGC